MSVLTAAVVLVGLLCTLDLILTLGVIARLREHTRILSRQDRGGAPSLPVGAEVGEFATSTVEGEAVTRDGLRAGTLVAFFSPTCQPCREKLPAFVEYARAMPGGRRRVLATVVGEADGAAALVSELSPVAQVVLEEHDGALSAAFQAVLYPTVLLVAPDEAGRLVVVDDKVDLDRPHAAVA